jgi:MFS family permease
MFISPVATMTVGRFGIHTCLYIGVILETAALIGASFAKEYWQLLLSQGFCFGFGMGFLYTGTAGVVSQWFTKKRSLANGIAASGGAGLGALVYNLAVNAMIQRISVAWAFRILGILAGVVNLVSAILMRDRNANVGTNQLPFDSSLLKKPGVVLVQVYGFFSQMGYIVLLFSLPNYAEYVGLTSHQGSTVAAMLALGTFLGRNFLGFLSDYFGPINVTGLATFLNGVFALCIFHFATSYGVSDF